MVARTVTQKASEYLGQQIVAENRIAPLNTPAEAQAKIRSAVVRALESPEVLQRFEALNIRPVKSSPEEFAARVKAEIGRWAETVRKAGIQPQE